MKFTKILPEKKLNEFVEYFFIMEPGPSYPPTCEDRIVIGPDGNFNLIFSLNECEWIKGGKVINMKKGSAYFLGQLTEFDKFIFNKRIRLIGAALSPYCFSNISGIPAYQLTNKMVEAAEVLPDIETALNEIRNEDDQAGLNKTVTAISAYISNKVSTVKKDKKKELIRNACRIVKSSPENMDVSKLAGKLFICKRLLEMRFREMVGIMPRKYINIFKIHMIVELISADPEVNLSWIANKFGFYDQSHFSREYKKVTSMSPKKHIRNEIRRLLHFEVISNGEKQNVPEDILRSSIRQPLYFQD